MNSNLSLVSQTPHVRSRLTIRTIDGVHSDSGVPYYIVQLDIPQVHK